MQTAHIRCISLPSTVVALVVFGSWHQSASSDSTENDELSKNCTVLGLTHCGDTGSSGLRGTAEV